MSKVRKDIFLWLAIAAMFVVGILLYPALPERMPMHWNAAGEVDNYGSKFAGTFGLPLTTLGIYVLFVFLPKLDPRKENYEKFTGAYEALKWITILFMTVLYGVVLSASLGYSPNVGLIVNLGVGVMFIIIGNYMGKIRHNYFVGIKTPWTLASEEVWVKTHRFAGPLWMLSGLIFIVSAFFASMTTFWIALALVFATGFLSMAYSYWVFRKLQ